MDNTSKIAFDAEVDLHVDSFIRSSNLVRYSIITLTIASILLFVGYHNSASDSWFNSRLKVAYTALHEEVWLKQPGELNGEKELARAWAQARGLRTAEEIKEHIKTLENEPQPSWLEWVQASKPSRKYVSTHHGAIKALTNSEIAVHPDRGDEG